MRNNKLSGLQNQVISNRVRKLSLATGIITALVGLLAGSGLVLVPIFLILGALIQPRFQRLGRGFICSGALLLTAFVLAFDFFAISEGNFEHRFGSVVISIASGVLVLVCDVEIVREEWRLRSTSHLRG